MYTVLSKSDLRYEVFSAIQPYFDLSDWSNFFDSLLSHYFRTLDPVEEPVVSLQDTLLDFELQPLFEQLGPVDADVRPVVRAVNCE